MAHSNCSPLLLLLLMAVGAFADVPDPSKFPPSTRFGSYSWGGDDAAYCNPCKPNPLAWTSNRVQMLGTRTIRVHFNVPEEQFVAAAQSDPYDDLFASPWFTTYLLTCDGGRQNVAAFATHLLTTFKTASKTFIFLNWESDNALGTDKANPPTPARWDQFVAAQNAKAQGVVDARAAVPDSQSRVFSGVEFNLVAWRQNCDHSKTDDCACNDSNRKCAISYALPRINVDYYSYSAWQTINDPAPQDMQAAVFKDYDFALNWVRKQRPSISQRNFLMGEYGWARERIPEDSAAQRVNATLRAIKAWGASYGIFWQIIDNNKKGGDFKFGAWLPPPQPNQEPKVGLAGEMLKNIFNGK